MGGANTTMVVVSGITEVVAVAVLVPMVLLPQPISNRAPGGYGFNFPLHLELLVYGDPGTYGGGTAPTPGGFWIGGGGGGGGYNPGGPLGGYGGTGGGGRVNTGETEPSQMHAFKALEVAVADLPQ